MSEAHYELGRTLVAHLSDGHAVPVLYPDMEQLRFRGWWTYDDYLNEFNHFSGLFPQLAPAQAKGLMLVYVSGVLIRSPVLQIEAAAAYADLMVERLGYDEFRPLLRGPYQLPQVPEEFFPVYDIRNFPEGVPVFGAGRPTNRAAFARESPYELVAAVGYEGETRLIKDIRGASGQLLFEPHQVVETERIGDDSITVLLVTEGMRFEATVFRAGEVEYVLAVQTEGRAPTRSSRNLARQLADVVLRDG